MAKTYRKVAEFKTVEDFSAYLKSENINIGLVPEVPADGSAALARKAVCKGRTIGNRWAILPMEGWDCMADGTPSEFTRRRWLNFAASGAKLLYGTEAAAVMHSGRSNPRQLLVADHTADALASICAEMRQAHKDRFGRNDDLVIGLQLTHSGAPSVLQPGDATSPTSRMQRWSHAEAGRHRRVPDRSAPVFRHPHPDAAGRRSRRSYSGSEARSPDSSPSAPAVPTHR
jgi:hypothetical protein